MTQLRTVTKVKNGELIDVYYDVTLIVDRFNRCIVVDNTIEDYHDHIDCDTHLVKRLKLDSMKNNIKGIDELV